MTDQAVCFFPCEKRRLLVRYNSRKGKGSVGEADIYLTCGNNGQVPGEIGHLR